MRELFARLRRRLTVRLEFGTADVIRPGDVVIWCVDAPMAKEQIDSCTSTLERLYPGVRFVSFTNVGPFEVLRDLDGDECGCGCGCCCCQNRANRLFQRLRSDRSSDLDRNPPRNSDLVIHCAAGGILCRESSNPPQFEAVVHGVPPKHEKASS